MTGDVVLPALPPIRTTASSPPSAPQADQNTRCSSSVETEEAGPTTPTSEESRLQPPTECPPAPLKPAWAAPAKRKFPSALAPAPSPARRAFFPVARDLSAVFRSLPPKKRIRAG